MKDEARSRSEGGEKAWEDLSWKERRTLVARLRRTTALAQDEIARTVAAETGKPVTEVLSQEVTATLEMLRYFEAAYPRRLRPKKFRYWRPGFWGKTNLVISEPLGTIGLVGPANFPFSLPVMTAAAGLLCGNRVVFKPSEKCPATARLIRRLFHESGFPRPALETVEGGEEAARNMIGRPEIRKVIFFGSYEAGRKVAALCGRHFKPCLLELGGSGAAIVRADADLRRAARGLAWSAFYAAGRSCLGTKAAYVHASVKSRLASLLVEEMRTLRSGEALDPSTDVCAFPEREAPLHARRFLRDARKRGATVRTSGGATLVVLDGPDSGKSPLPEGEIPYPLLVLCPVGSDEEALRAANGSGYGLGASIWTRDKEKATALAGRLQAGLVWVNDASVGLPRSPWGGLKRSGWGRLFSELALSELISTKVISVENARLGRRKFWWFPYSQRKYDLLFAVNALAYGAKRLRTLFSFLISRAAQSRRRRPAVSGREGRVPSCSIRVKSPGRVRGCGCFFSRARP